MPPWAAPEWDLVGYTLLITATSRSPATSRAARSPASPEPTIITSCLNIMGLSPGNHVISCRTWPSHKVAL